MCIHKHTKYVYIHAIFIYTCIMMFILGEKHGLYRLDVCVHIQTYIYWYWHIKKLFFNRKKKKKTIQASIISGGLPIMFQHQLDFPAVLLCMCFCFYYGKAEEHFPFLMLFDVTCMTTIVSEVFYWFSHSLCSWYFLCQMFSSCWIFWKHSSKTVKAFLKVSLEKKSFS